MLKKDLKCSFNRKQSAKKILKQNSKRHNSINKVNEISKKKIIDRSYFIEKCNNIH